MRTGMEPFIDFCNAIVYAVTQIRIEYRASLAYRRNMPRTVEHGAETKACAQTRSISL